MPFARPPTMAMSDPRTQRPQDPKTPGVREHETPFSLIALLAILVFLL